MGKWMSYKVDKYLPTSIAAIAADNEHWVPYCEKAYAKRYKTYENDLVDVKEIVEQKLAPGIKNTFFLNSKFQSPR